MIVLAYPPAALGEVEIGLTSPEMFLDLKMPDTGRAEGQQQFVRAIQREITGLSDIHLGDDRKLNITFEQVDLAGHVAPMTGRRSQETRVINSLDPVRLKFTYEVMDVGGIIVKSGSEDLKHFVTQADMHGRDRNRELFLERRMMREWFMQNIANN